MTGGGTRSDLLERSGVLECVEQVLAGALEGRGSMMVVRGPAGLGKTAVLGAATGQARQLGFTVLSATGRPMESDLPYEVVLQLFERLLARWDGAEDLLGGNASVAAAVFDRRPGSGRRDRSDQSVVHALYWLTSNLCWSPGPSCTRPVALVIDDLHWVDGPSLAFLSYLAGRLHDLPVAVLAAWRPGEPGPSHAAATRLCAEAETVTADLQPLSGPAVAELLERRNPGWSDPVLTAACRTATGGNPFLLHSLLSELGRRSGASPDQLVAGIEHLAPEAVLRSVTARLARLDPAATALAQAAAVTVQAPLAIVAELARLDVDAATAAADALVRADILAPGERVAFAHPLIRSVVEAEMGPFSRAQAHRRAADLLDRDPSNLALVASHLMESPPGCDPWVLERLRAAAVSATEMGATAVAARLLARALEEPPPAADRYRLLRDLAAAETAAGLDGAEGHLRAALELAPTTTDRARTRLALGSILYSAGRHAEAADAFSTARAELAPDDPLGPPLDLLAAAASILLPDRTAEAAACLSGLAARPGPARADASALSAMYATMAGRPAVEVRQLAGPALEVFEQGRATLLDPALAVSALSFALVTTDDLDRAEGLATATIESARRRGAGDTFAWASHLRAWTFYLQGRLDEAIADVEAALAATPVAMHLASGLAVMALARTETGDLEGAASAVKEALALPLESRTEQAVVALTSGELALAGGDPARALEEFRRSGQAMPPDSAGIPLSWRTGAARAALAVGDRESAIAYTCEARARAERFGAARSVGMARWAAGLVTGGPDGLRLLADAVEVLEGSQSRLELVRASVDLGAALRRAGQRVEARNRLSAALDLTHRLGARSLEERAVAELRATGARPRRAATTGPDALTPSERRVAGMAAAGDTNREIAQKLFVSVKAVEAHLARAYAKLGIASRRELPAALAG